MLTCSNNVVMLGETNGVVVVCASAEEIYVNSQRTTVNSPWVCITSAQSLLTVDSRRLRII